MYAVSSAVGSEIVTDLRWSALRAAQISTATSQRSPVRRNWAAKRDGVRQPTGSLGLSGRGGNGRALGPLNQSPLAPDSRRMPLTIGYQRRGANTGAVAGFQRGSSFWLSSWPQVETVPAGRSPVAGAAAAVAVAAQAARAAVARAMAGRGRATGAPIMPAAAGTLNRGRSSTVRETFPPSAPRMGRMGSVTTRRRAAGLILAAGLGLGVAACAGDGDERGGGAAPATRTAPATSAPAPEPAPEPRPRALAGLPAFTAGFQGWDRLNAEPIPPDSPQTRRAGFDAHRSTKDVYVSVPRERLRRGGEFPVGTIIVKAGRTGGEITLAAVMRKLQGVDPAHGDWEFVEYKRSGADAPFATSASLTGATCWGCHQIAEDTDWVFTPLDP